MVQIDAEKLVKAAMQMSWRESRFATPDPQRHVGLMELLQFVETQGASAEQIDIWLQEAQDAMGRPR